MSNTSNLSALSDIPFPSKKCSSIQNRKELSIQTLIEVEEVYLTGLKTQPNFMPENIKLQEARIKALIFLKEKYEP